MVRWMPCHWPMKTRVTRSFTTADPSSPIKMASWKSAIRQLWANSGTVRVAKQTRIRSLDRKAFALSRAAAQESFRIDNSWAAFSHGSFAPVGLANRRFGTPWLATWAIFLRRFAAQKGLDSLKLH